MRRELTIEQIRVNLKKEYAIKPGRIGVIEIVAGAICSVLFFGTGRLPATLIGIIVIVIGIFEKVKSNRIKHKIDTGEIVIQEGRCIEKRIQSGTAGPKRYFYFTKKKSYMASQQDIRLWEKTQVGDKFYLVYFQDEKEIKKIYPQKVFKYE